MAYDQMEKHAEAVKDWSRVIELSSPPEQAGFRVQRADSRVRTGQVTEAVAEVADLTKSRKWDAGKWYDFACIYALASGKSADKKQEYADRAMELLHQAVKAGYKDAAHMAKDKDLDALRGRDDFKKLLADLNPPFGRRRRRHPEWGRPTGKARPECLCDVLFLVRGPIRHYADANFSFVRPRRQVLSDADPMPRQRQSEATSPDGSLSAHSSSTASSSRRRRSPRRLT